MNAYILLVITIIAFSLAVLFEKKALDILDSQEAILFKGILYLLLGILTFIIFKCLNKSILDQNKYKNYKKGLVYIFFAYILIFAVGNMFFYYVLKRTKEITKASFILVVFNTINILIISYFLRGERINLLTLIGLIIAITGVHLTLRN